MKMLTNLTKPTSGDVEILGEKLTDKSYELLKEWEQLLNILFSMKN